MAATTLSAGNVAIIQFNSDDADDPHIPGVQSMQRDSISFVLLAPVGSDTIIYFTDRTWTASGVLLNGGSFSNSGADGTYAWTAATDLAAGTVITITEAELTAAGIELIDTGEAIYVYQGTNANTPTGFLHAVEYGDTNDTFNASLGNTGLVAGTSALAIAEDNGSFGERLWNLQTPELFQNINSHLNWHTNENSPQTNHVEGTNLFVAPDVQLWIAGISGGHGLMSVSGDATQNGGLGYNVQTHFQNTADDGNGVTTTSRFWSPTHILFDTVEGKFFIVDSSGSFDRILQGNISDMLNNPGVAPPMTILWQDDPVGVSDGDGITGMQVDIVNNHIYFTANNQLLRVNYNTGDQTAVVLADLGVDGDTGSNNWANELALDLANGRAFIISTESFSDFQYVPPGFPGAFPDAGSPTGFTALVTTMSQNSIHMVSNISPSDTNATGNTIVQLTFNAGYSEDNSIATGTPQSNEFEDSLGRITDVDVNTLTGDIWFTAVQIGVPNATGGIYRATLNVGTGALTVTTIHNEGASNRNYLHIHIDEETGFYYATSAEPGQQGNHSVYRGALNATPGTAPTFFATVGNINEMTPRDLTVESAPTLNGTTLTPTVTEADNDLGSGETAQAALYSGLTASDIDTSGGDELAGAQVRISGNFQSGAGHQDFLRINGNTSGTIAGSGINYSYDSSTGVITLSGAATVAEYAAALQLVTFSTSGDNITVYGTAGSRTISASVFDGLLYSDEMNATVTVVGINDTPVNDATPSSASGNEDAAAIAITGLGVSDVDADPANQDIQFTLSVTNGTLDIRTDVAGGIEVGDITGGADGSSTITITATQNQINATLANGTGLQFTPTANFNGTAVLTMTTNDLGLNGDDPGASGDGTSEQDSDTVNITVTAQNDAPALANLGDTVTTLEQTAVVLDTNALVSDIDLDPLNGGNGSYTGATLTIARNGGANAQDSFGFNLTGASFTVSGTVASGNLQSGGSTFATYSNSGGTLLITFTASGTAATSALVDDVLQHVAYTNTSDTPPANVVLNYTFNDGSPGNGQGGGAAAATATGTTTVNITPVNDEPTLAATAQNPTFTEGGAVADLFSAVTASTIEASQTFISMTLTVTNVTDGASEILRIDGSDLALTDGNSVASTAINGLTVNVSVVGTTATVSFSGATLSTAALQTLVDGLAYSNTSQDPTDANRVVTITQLVDSGSNTAPDDSTATLSIASTVNVDPVNDEPTLAAAAQNPTFTEGGAVADLFNAVTASTVEAGQTFTSMTLTVTNVTEGANEILSFDGSDVALTNGNSVASTATNGLTVNVSVSGSTATVSFSGESLSAAALQTLIDGLSYRNTSDNPTDANRVVTITQLVDSGSNTNPNDNTAALSTASTVNVDPTNDAPVSTITPTSYNGLPGVSLDLKNNGLAVSDVDGNSGSETVTLSVTEGTLTVTAGGSGAGVSGSGTGSVTITGTVAQINALLNTDGTSTVSYINNAPTGPITLELAINDEGNTGGGDLTASDTAILNINPPPMITDLGGDIAAFTEDGAAVLLDSGTAATVTDDQVNFNGGNVTASTTGNEVAGEDVLGIDDSGTVDLSDGTNVGSVVSVGGTPIGTVTSDGTGGNDLVVTFNTIDATPANVSLLIQALTYLNSNPGNPSINQRTIAVSVNDGLGGTDSETVTVNITTVNDAPVVTAATLAAVDEDTASPAGQSVAAIFNGPFADPDDAAETITGILVSENTANAATEGTWQYSTGGGNWFDIGSVSDAGALALSAATLVRFVPVANFNGAPTGLTVYGLDNTYGGGFTVADTSIVQLATSPNGGTTAISGNSTTLGTTISAVNDQPSFVDLGVNVLFTENGPPVVLDADATIADLELDGADNFDGATLTLMRSGGADAEDVFGASGTLSFSGSDVLVDATIVGTFTNTAGTLAIAFNANATSASVDSVLQQITYSNPNDTPPVTVDIDYMFNDGNAGAQGTGGALQASGTVQVVISFTNDAPVSTVPAGPLSATEETDLAITGLAVSDADSGAALITVTLSVLNGTLTVRDDVAGGLDQFEISGNGTSTVTVNCTPGHINTTFAALDGVLYRGNLDFFGADTLTMTSNDGGANGNDPGGDPGSEEGIATVQINVANVNDQPSFVKGADATVNEDAGAQTIAGWATAISQGPNETGQVLTFNASVAATTGNLAFSSAPTIDPTTGNLTFTTAANTNGTATIDVTLSDNGPNTAPNDNISPVQTFTITVDAVNDAPTFTVGASSTVNEDSGAASVANFASNFQPGPPAATDEAAQTLVGYTIVGNTNAGLFSVGPALASDGTLTYTSALDAHGTATITVVATDSGSGTSPNVQQSAPLTFDIVIGSVNDAPTAAASAITTNQNTAHAFAAPEFAFTDASDNPTNSLMAVIIGLLATHGTLTFNGNPVAVNDVIQANQLGNLAYTPDPGYSGPDSFGFRVRDNGTTANGGQDTSANMATMSITVGDITPPAAPVILAFSTDTGAIGDNITSDHTLTLTGTAEAASTVTIYDGAMLLGTSTASGLGAWTFDTGVLTSALHSFQATATDAADNTGALSAVLAVTVVPEPEPAPAVPFVYSGIAADFDGDGLQDVLQINEGAALVWLSAGNQFQASQLWASDATASDQAADVNGDGKADLVQFYNGHQYVALSNGASAFAPWAIWVSGATASDQLGDFNGDGRADVLQLYNGNQYVALSDGSSFGDFQQWGTGSLPSDRAVNANSDGMTDLFEIYDGHVWTTLSNGTSFDEWHNGLDGVTASDRPADVNGDGLIDVVQYYHGNIYVAPANGPVQGFTPFSVWQTGATADDQLGDFNGDGQADLLQLYNGTAYVALSNGADFDDWSVWASGATAGDRPVDLNGDDRSDLLQVHDGHSYVAISTGTSFDNWQMWA